MEFQKLIKRAIEIRKQYETKEKKLSQEISEPQMIEAKYDGEVKIKSSSELDVDNNTGTSVTLILKREM